jgi:hypothetical protein
MPQRMYATGSCLIFFCRVGSLIDAILAIDVP